MDRSSSPQKFAKLIALPGPLQTVEPDQFVLGSKCRIGRALDCDVVVQDQSEQFQYVSRLHAVIEYTDDLRYKLYDRQSTNHTFVNGLRIQDEYWLENNDLIGLGMMEAVLRFSDPDATTTKYARLIYNEKAMKFFVEQKELKLSRDQLLLLHHLFKHAYELCSRESCAKALWSRDYKPDIDSDALNQAIYKLRAKLKETAPGAEELVQTRPGLGYMLLT